MTDKDFARIECLIKSSEEKLEAKIAQSTSMVMAEVGKWVEDYLISEIDKKADKTDILRLERKIDHLSARVYEHDQEFNRLKTY